jgi:aminomethyltransferase
MTAPGPVFQLALNDIHAGLGAEFGVYAGWAVPLRYGDVVEEYEAVRQRAALFDRSYRSRILLTGTDALEVLRSAFAGAVQDLEEGGAMRTVSLDAGGNIEDLVLVARTGGIAYLVSGEPGQRSATLARLQAAVGEDFDVRIDDRTETTCLLGLAGPGAADAVREQLSEVLPARLEPLHSITFQFHGFRALAVRTSDVGEDGFEFMLAPAVAQHLVETLHHSGTRLAGFQALEVARVEAAIPAFEPDLSPGLSPAEADLDVLLGVPGGREERILAALLFEEGGAGAGAPILIGDRQVGELRSCLRSPGLNGTIGLGIIESRVALPGQAVSAGGMAATVVAKPFYRRRASSNG